MAQLPDQATLERWGWGISILPALLWILGWFALKFVLPAFPGLVSTFGASHHDLQLSIVAFLLCYALTQPVWGSLSERYGRRPILLFALGVCALGSCVVVFSSSMDAYVLGRCLEGVGAGAISPVCRALFVDTYERSVLAKKVAVISSIVALMPAVAPLVAGYMVVHLGWRSVFVLFGGLTILLMLLTAWRLPETVEQQGRPSFKGLLAQYGQVLKHPIFWRATMIYALLTGGLIAYYAATPFWYVFHFKISESIFSYFSLFSALCYIAGTFGAKHFIKVHSIKWVQAKGVVLLLGYVIGIAGLALVPSSIPVLIVIASGFGFLAGWMMPSASAVAMTALPAAAGAASAMLTLTIFGLSSVLSIITMKIDVSTLLQPVGYFSGLAILAGLLAWRVKVA